MAPLCRCESGRQSDGLFGMFFVLREIWLVCHFRDIALVLVSRVRINITVSEVSEISVLDFFFQ